MKHLLTLSIVIFMAGNCCYSQSVIEDIANELCNNLGGISLDRPNEVIVQESMQIIRSTYQNNQNTFIELLPEYAKTYKDKTDEELVRKMGVDLTYLLMKDCPPYQRMTMFNNNPVPEISPEIEEAGDSFTKLLIQRTTDTVISQSVINECIDEVFIKHAEELGDKFDTEYVIKFEQEFKAYLMTRCEPYMRWVANQLN